MSDIARKAAQKIWNFKRCEKFELEEVIQSAIEEATRGAWQEHDDVVAALAIANETIKQLGARNQQQSADTKRLDWLDEHGNWREVIDAAMKESVCTCNRVNRGAPQHSSICLLAQRQEKI